MGQQGKIGRCAQTMVIVAGQIEKGNQPRSTPLKPKKTAQTGNLKKGGDGEGIFCYD